jgi:hypothetical protein
MVTAPPAPDTARTAQVRSATRRKLAGEPTPREEKKTTEEAAEKATANKPKSKRTAPAKKASS